MGSSSDIQKPTFEDWFKIEGYEGDKTASELEYNLTQGLSFSLPNIDWDDEAFKIPKELMEAVHSKPTPITIDNLTSRQFGGNGVFDAIMESLYNHLNKEYESGRISGAGYSQAWLGCMQAALSGSIQFLLNKDKAYWESLQAQITALTSLIGNYTAKVQLAIAQAQAHQNRANYALTKLKLASENANYGYAMENMEAARAQTLDSRLTDKLPVKGTVGKQKDLYTQQIESYKRDIEIKTATILTDAFSTQKTIDEGTQTPAELQSDKISSAVKNLRTNVGI